MGNGAKTGIEKAVVGAVAAVAVVKGVKGAKHRHDGGTTADEHRRDEGSNGSTHSKPDREEAGDEARVRGGDEESDGGSSSGVKPLVRKANDYQRSHAWLGFPMGVAKKFGEDQAGNLAALISYYTFFSLFPLLLALVTILGFVLGGDPELQRKIVDSALVQFPVIGDQIRDNIGSLDGN